ncbi:MAG: carboxylating nicotinate-nucleotide diphosphorylase [Gammaproteobacteria bacterium]|nr:carboxylating nicotinate-nucleotide diphosphorylase [Gammaproteobacteria bacterium]MBT8444691.1 carboxylating nicotinate-nucleotide diphosphorylase [Gammaproteobacteria bacterium]
MSDSNVSAALAKYLMTSVGVALAEDVGPGDLTAELVPADQRAVARVVTRENCVICGQPWFDEVFTQIDKFIDVEWRCQEGQRVGTDQELCEIRGPARAVLTGERTALNFLQLLSATATAARRYADAVAGTATVILDTRKTIPGLRLAQKYAVKVGGAENHRIGLYDAILIKENHITAAGGIGAAVGNAMRNAHKVLIEVEVETLDQLAETLATPAHRVLLDNFSLSGMRKAVAMRNDRNEEVTLEASGGITLENVRQIAETGVDFISIGALTKDIQAIDLSMRFHSFK